MNNGKAPKDKCTVVVCCHNDFEVLADFRNINRAKDYALDIADKTSSVSYIFDDNRRQIGKTYNINGVNVFGEKNKETNTFWKELKKCKSRRTLKQILDVKELIHNGQIKIFYKGDAAAVVLKKCFIMNEQNSCCDFHKGDCKQHYFECILFYRGALYRIPKFFYEEVYEMYGIGIKIGKITYKEGSKGKDYEFVRIEVKILDREGKWIFDFEHSFYTNIQGEIYPGLEEFRT